MTALAKLGTGVSGLDVLAMGGIPEGRSTLIAGRSGTGKTVMSLQIAAHLAAQGVQTIFLATEEAADDLKDSGDALGLRTSQLAASGTFNVVDLASSLEGPTFVSGEYDILGLSHRLEALVRQTGARALVLDSATALFSARPRAEALRNHFFQLVDGLRRLNLTAVIIAESTDDYGFQTTLGVEDYVCDMTIVLRNVNDGGRRRRSIEVAKYRRSGHYKGEYPCTITSTGVAVFPLDVKERAPAAGVERYSSGVPGLDEMTCGGWLRNSIVIVRGPTGSGKTLLAGLYARAGASRRERVVYFGFEETPSMLLRNFRAIGMAMEPLVGSGHLKVICRQPQASSPEDLLVDLHVNLDELKPALVVMDSISSIEHTLSPQGFRQFVIGVASILREHGRSALITEAVPSTRIIEAPTAYLSAVADAILSLTYATGRFDLDRELRVIKMRGSHHEPHPYRLTIGADGLSVTRFQRSDPLH
jgi:circadian clock protein KaiC